MKRRILIFLSALLVGLCMVPLTETDALACSRSRRVARLVRRYRSTEGMKVTPVGTIGMKAARFMGGLFGGADDDFSKVLSAVGGLEKIYIVNYSECRQGVKQRFSSSLERILGTQDKVMEFKGGDSPMAFYGMTSKNGEKISDLVLHCPSQGVLVCFLGSISSSDVRKMAKAFGY